MSDMHMLAAAYAAGALDQDEHELFEAHHRSCVQCEVEVRELLETTALLGVAVAQPAPPGMRDAVMAEVARTRQLPPVVVSLSEHATRRSALRRFGLTAAACLAVFTIGLGAYANQLADENSDLQARNEQLAEIMTAADAKTYTATDAGATATATVSKAANRGEFLSRGLLLRPNRTYQLWLIGPNGARSAGVFSPNDGRHDPIVFTGPGDATAIAVTDEPKGGSAQPTTKPMLMMTLKKV